MVRDVRYITLNCCYRDLHNVLLTGHLKTLALVESAGETQTHADREWFRFHCTLAQTDRQTCTLQTCTSHILLICSPFLTHLFIFIEDIL